ncbi:MAG TPA: radical SAM protein [Desulfomonilia bacterium]|nr:radical SAM protein [Desulfomonilia bacterium]
MLIPELDRTSIVQSNLDEYGPDAASMKWLDPQETARSEDARKGLLESISGQLLSAFNETKPFHLRISTGCRLCGEGSWSCLFINNLCNAGCFFCPSRQDNHDEPGTSTLTFTSPEDYGDYLAEFGFTGSSISGGEPLLAFDKTVSFIRHIRDRFGDGMYLWLYTNGTLAAEDNIRMLSDAGLNEIRFNITATGYDLAKARLASRFIKNVTVEIPAVPEDYETMKAKIKEMADSGITFLNLHQIRCTKHNFRKLSERGYTFLHGPQIGILESELAALRLLNYAVEQHIDLGVNYCSLIYRHRFQTRSSRMRWAPLMAKPFEGVTDAGMIRTIRTDADPGTIERIRADLDSGGCDPALWSTLTDKGRLLVAAKFLDMIDHYQAAIKLSYAITSVRPGITYLNPFREIRLASGKKIAVERATAFADIDLSGPGLDLFKDSFLTCRKPSDMDAVYARALLLGESDAHAKKWQKIIQAESLRSGLLEYY